PVYFVKSVNGNYADEFGNIELETGAGLTLEQARQNGNVLAGNVQVDTPYFMLSKGDPLSPTGIVSALSIADAGVALSLTEDMSKFSTINLTDGEIQLKTSTNILSTPHQILKVKQDGIR